MAKIKRDVDGKPSNLGLSSFGTFNSESYASSNHFELVNFRYSHLEHKDRSGDRGYTPVSEITRRFIKLDKSFRRQLSEQQHLFVDCSEYLLHERMKISSELLLSCVPDAISLEITDDKSIFYTWKKNDITIYLDHYLIDEFDGKDEAIVSIYKGDNKIADLAGSLDEVILCVNKALVSESIGFMAFAA
jgi:hypothetical protein